MRIADFKPGQRIQLSPATDWWMRGARYGEVIAVNNIFVRVRLDTDTIISVRPRDILEIVT